MASKSREINRQYLKTIQADKSTIEEDSPKKQKEEDKLICLIRTQEPHLKRAVERRSHIWVENKSKFPGSQLIFDVKFEFQDQPSDY